MNAKLMHSACRRQISARLFLLTLLTFGLVAGCGPAGHTVRSRNTPARFQVTKLPIHFSLPSGYNDHLLAADPQRPGVWIWSARTSFEDEGDGPSTDSRVWHVTDSGASSSWSLGSSGSLTMGTAALPALAACGGKAWFGINRHIVGIDESRGVIASLTLPDSNPVPEVDSHLPPQLGLEGVNAVTAIACSGNTVAIAGANADVGFVLDARSQSFKTVPLPRGTFAVAAGAASNGTVAFGLQSYEVGPTQVLVADTGVKEARTIPVIDSQSIHLVRNGQAEWFAVGPSGQRLDVSRGAANTSVRSGVEAFESYPVGPMLLPATGVLSDGRMLLPGPNGIVVAGPGDTAPEQIPLGMEECPVTVPPPGIKDVQSTTAHTGSTATCPVTPFALAIDGSGTIWYQTQKQNPVIVHTVEID